MSAQAIDYQKLFENSPVARLVIEQSKKDHFHVAHANQAAVKYFCPESQESCETIDGMSLPDFLDQTNTTHILQALSVCYGSRVPISVQVLPKTSKKIHIQSFLLSPVMDENGAVSFVDMQARPPATQQLTAERERDDAISMFTTVFDVSDVGFTVTDHHGRFVRINDKFIEMTGWQPIDLMGEELTKIIPEKDHEIAWSRHQDALREHRKNFGEVRILKRDGGVMNVMVTSSMMELSNGRSFRITTVVDITELKHIERDLRQAKDDADEANTAKSAFLANMSHELRTPLNAIIGFSEMMMNGTLGVIDNPNYIEYLSDIKFSAQHLLHIINDVLDMSKIEAGKMPLDEESVNIVGLIESVRRLMTAKAEEKKISIKIKEPETLYPIMIDERLVRQVFLNLLSNAVKFSHEGETIDLQIDINVDKGLTLKVIDYGIGIPQERIEEVLEPFGQVSDPSLNKGQGTGLGLPIARAMMDMHNGTLSIHSEKDKGTIVTCVFPASRLIIDKLIN